MNSMDAEFVQDLMFRQDAAYDKLRQECGKWEASSRGKTVLIERMENEIDRLKEEVETQARQIQDLKAACAWKDERA